MTDRGNFAEILDGYLGALEAGNAPDREALLARHPDLAGDLQAALLGIDFVHGAAPRLVPEEHADALPGRSLGDYRLLRELGRGGMAVVYEAEQVSLGRRVALKVLPFAAVLDPKQLQRFKNEAMAAAHLRHRNIVPVYGVGVERGVHYYAMQYVEGQSLATAIRELKGGGAGEGARTPISSHGSNREPAYIRMAASLGVQAAEALDHAHQLGIVHRDVKPGNLLVDQVGTLWVTDFGLASSVADVGLTVTGELLGTIRYMSPEQAQAKRVPIDHRTDVYSLGATLYEFFTLEPAFPGDDPHLVIQDIASKEPVAPRRLNPALPRDLETVILKAMSKDPAGRYTTAQEMADDLGRFLEDRPVEAKRPGPFRRAAKWSRRHRTLVGATAALLLLSTFGLATRYRAPLARAGGDQDGIP
jgi:eukaryotic-like serine/threonine-protein kinase